MAHKRKGQLTITKEWAMHLRKFWRRQFWKGERSTGKKVIRMELEKKEDVALSLLLIRVSPPGLVCRADAAQIGEAIFIS